MGKYPSPVSFFWDRASYLFYHPFDNKEISMHMYYVDMKDPELHVAKRKFVFRIAHQLAQFGKDYQPANTNQALSIEFSSEMDCQTFRDKVYAPVIRRNM
jgi:hypothetical protein